MNTLGACSGGAILVWSEPYARIHRQSTVWPERTDSACRKQQQHIVRHFLLVGSLLCVSTDGAAFVFVLLTFNVSLLFVPDKRFWLGLY